MFYMKASRPRQDVATDEKTVIAVAVRKKPFYSIMLNPKFWKLAIKNN